MSLARALERRRLIVCVGTGGVGKTTIAAAIALGAARRGRRAVVLTIDPARALARALGLASLGPEPEAVPGAEGLEAAMLAQKHAWDALVARHAPSAEAARAVYGNHLYQQLSTSFAGSTEYVALEETCRLAESGRHDLIVLDTPPAAHALDFLRAPERLDRLLDPRVAGLLARPAGGLARLIGRATGGRTAGEIAGFFAAIAAFAERLTERTRAARGLLASGDAGLVLVATPRQLGLDDTEALAGRVRALPTALAGVVCNRVHAAPPAEARAELERLDADAASRAWLRAACDDATGAAAAERGVIAGLARALPDVPIAAIAEEDHDLHRLVDLDAIARALWSAAPPPELT